MKQLISLAHAEWIQEKTDKCEELRAFHDDQGHSWTETATRCRLPPTGYPPKSDATAPGPAFHQTAEEPGSEPKD